MARGLFAGMTDYSHQSLDDIVTDLTEEAENLTITIKNVDEWIEASKKNGYWGPNVPSSFKGCVTYAIKHYKTAVNEIKDILADLAIEIKEHHCRRLKNIADIATEINHNIGKIWHQDYDNKEYELYEFKIIESIYAETRGMAANLLDFSNIAARLEHFIGRTKTAGRTKATANNPWISGSFYLFAAMLLLTALAAIANWVSWYALPVVTIGGALLVGIIGALQLRNDERLKEETFVTLMTEAYKRLFLLRHKAEAKNTTPK